MKNLAVVTTALNKLQPFIWSAVVVFILWGLYPITIGRNTVTLRSRAQYDDGRIATGHRVREWRLQVPSNFGVGTYYVWSNPPFDPSTNRGGQLAYLNSNIDTTGAVVPYRPTSEGHGNPNRQFAITMSAAPLQEYQLARDDYCLTDDDIVRLRSKRDQSYGGTGCQKPACNVWMNYFGWQAHVSVDSGGLYRDPQRVCAILRRTLDSWTATIDDLRQRDPKNH